MDFIFIKLWHEEFKQKISQARLNKVRVTGSLYHFYLSEWILNILLHSGDPIIFFGNNEEGV